jgi:hypothetical protein
MIHSKNPTEDLFDESLSLTKTPRHDSLNITEGVLTRRMMKIQLTWKVLSPPPPFSLPPLISSHLSFLS